MRILKEFESRGMKVTIFSWNGKVSFKFEKNLLEQIFKFRDGSGMDTLAEAEAFLDDEFLQHVDQQLSTMEEKRYERWVNVRNAKGEENQFDMII